MSVAVGVSTAAPHSPSRRTVIRLAAYFGTLAIVPLAITVWILVGSAERRQRNEIDTRLAFVLRSGQVELAALAGEASSRAAALAQSPHVQQALLDRSRSALAKIAADSPGIALAVGKTLTVGSTPALALHRSAVVVGPHGAVGTVTVSVPLDSALVARLEHEVVPSGAESFAIARAGKVIAGAERGSRIVLQGRDAILGGRRVRATSTSLVSGPVEAQLVALAPEAAIEDPVRRYRDWLYAAVAATLAALVLLARALGSPIARSVRDLANVARQADRDELTGLANRRGFNERLGAELARARRQGSTVAVVIADLDDFKRVNDTYGHHGGDAALTAFADVLQQGTREIDAAARYGGEEFAVILPDTDAAGARLLAERLRQEFQACGIDAGRQRFTVTASFGVASAVAPENAVALIAEADAALYRAKANGKNRVES